jgi:hypothetical protein
MSNEHKTKMAPNSDAPAGLEFDSKGNAIPFAKRPKNDQQKTTERLTNVMRDASIKDPEQEAEHPAPMPKDQQGKGAAKSHHHDLEGQQGGTNGGGREDL